MTPPSTPSAARDTGSRCRTTPTVPAATSSPPAGTSTAPASCTSTPRTGAIEEIGFWQPVFGSASAAHWVGDGYVYVIDYGRGIDILRFDELAPRPSDEEIRASWQARMNDVDPLAATERSLCRLAQQ